MNSGANNDPYVYEGTRILRNIPGIKDQAVLDAHEREAVTQRLREGAPKGNFDFAHLKAIHRPLFQDVYDWAGEPRTVEISKGGDQFQFRQFLDKGVAYVHGEIKKANFLRGLKAEEFAAKAGKIIGDLNYAHPFREGNGRTQFTFLMQLGQQAGHRINPARIQGEDWIAASRFANRGDTTMMSKLIASMIMPKTLERDGPPAFPTRQRDGRDGPSE